MTFTSKAIVAALFLSLTPAVASAQGISGGSDFLPRNGSVIGEILRGGGWVPNPGVGAPVAAQDCGAGHAQHFVGHNIMYVPVPEGTRVIGPNTFVTGDYDPTRLSIDHDASGTVSRVYCG